MNPFIIRTDEKGALRQISSRIDSYSMNWVKKDSAWGIAKVPDGINGSV